MNEKERGGFRECEHTADGELEVWAEDLASLFAYAARGMYALAGIELDEEPRCSHKLHLSATDDEALLVSFLSELLFIWEQHHLAFDVFQLIVQDQKLNAGLEGAPIKSASRQIKAVTYHHLHIDYKDGFYRTRVVFDL